MTDLIEYLRLITAATLLLTLVILGARVNRWWCSRWRCLLPAAGTGAIALFVALGTIDALLHHRAGGLATGFIVAASVGLLMQACTVGLGRSHIDGHAAGPYMAYDPAKTDGCAPRTPSC